MCLHKKKRMLSQVLGLFEYTYEQLWWCPDCGAIKKEIIDRMFSDAPRIKYKRGRWKYPNTVCEFCNRDRHGWR